MNQQIEDKKSELKAQWDVWSNISKQESEARKLWYKIKSELIALSPYKVRDKVEYIIIGKESQGVQIVFIYQISVVSEEFNYTVSPPKKDGTQSAKPINWIKINVLNKITPQ